MGRQNNRNHGGNKKGQPTAQRSSSQQSKIIKVSIILNIILGIAAIVNPIITYKVGKSNATATTDAAKITADAAIDSAKITALASDNRLQSPAILVNQIEQTSLTVKDDRNQCPLPKLEFLIQGGKFSSGIPVQMSLYQKNSTSINFKKTFDVPYCGNKQIVNLDEYFPEGFSIGDYQVDFLTTDSNNAIAQKSQHFQHRYVINYFRDGDAILHDNSRMEIIDDVIKIVTDSDGYVTAEMLPTFKLENGDVFYVTGVINVINGQPRFQLIVADKGSSAKGFGERFTTYFWEHARHQERSAKLVLRREGATAKGDVEADRGYIPQALTDAYLSRLPKKFHFCLKITAREHETTVASYLSESKFELSNATPIFEKTLKTYAYQAASLVGVNFCVLLRANMTGTQQLESLEIYKNPKTSSWLQSLVDD